MPTGERGGLVPISGTCPAGSAVGTTGEMMHVWNIDYEPGPFGELDAVALREAVLQHFGIGATTS